MRYNGLIIVILFVVPLKSHGQITIKLKDSIAVKNQIEGFYFWYFDMIKEKRLNKDFNPSFKRQKNGMTTLDFKNYRAGLRKYKFSEDFIERKVGEYNDCVENLKTVPYDTFVKFELDEHEQLLCNFSNIYEWTGGMEPKEKVSLSSLAMVDRKTIIGQVNFISYSQPKGHAIVTFNKFKGAWWINNLTLGH